MTVAGVAARFSDEALEATLRNNYGSAVDADLPEELRFVRGVARLAKKRFREGVESPSDMPVLFLLHPSAPPVLSEPRSTRYAPMIDDGRTALGRSVWFVNFAVTEGVGLEMTEEDDAGLFSLVRDEMSLGALPAAIVDTRDGAFNLRYYPEGLNKSELRQLTDLSRRTISPSDVYDALNDIYLRDLCSPSSQTHGTGTWKSAAELRPHEDAEARVQRVLKVGLGAWFTGFTIREEQTQSTGRLDLEIEEPHMDDASTVTRHMLLELKVLRAKHVGGGAYSNSKNLTALRDGLVQARTYRDERNVRASALCCFDMRAVPAGDAGFATVEADAASWGVSLWMWHLFHTDKDYRQSLVEIDEVVVDEEA